MGKPSKGTPADKRLKANRTSSSSSTASTSKTMPFGGKKAAPFGSKPKKK